MSRRKSRMVAIQYIYSKEFQTDSSPDEFIEYINTLKKDRDREFAKRLIDGTLDFKEKIDALIAGYAQTGDDMIMLVDRCILRVGIFELLYLKSAPHPIVINEYIELTKSLSKESSKSFINAVLDKVRLNEHEK